MSQSRHCMNCAHWQPIGAAGDQANHGYCPLREATLSYDSGCGLFAESMELPCIGGAALADATVQAKVEDAT